MTLNANCGARSRTSIIINGFTVLVIMFALMPLFKYVPQPVIGAVLVPVAIGMIKLDLYRHYWRVDKPSLLICFITWAVCVFIDPTYAIIVAILMGLLRSARNEGAAAPARWTMLKAHRVYKPAGKWDYTNSTEHLERIREARKDDATSDVVVSMDDVFLMDLDGIDALKALVGSEVPIVGLQEAVLVQCAKQKWFEPARAKGLVLNSINARVGEADAGDTFNAYPTAELIHKKGTSPSSSSATSKKPSERGDALDPTDITLEEVHAVQAGWANAIKTISRTYLNGGDYVQAAAEAAGELYGYGHSSVLFKPTKATNNPFRPTANEAMSYFVGGGAVKSGYDEDAGFAINGGKGWKEVRIENHQVDLNGNTAAAMGSYTFTCATTGKEVRVEYSFGYKKNADGKVRIFLHHSSVPYKEEPSKAAGAHVISVLPVPSQLVSEM